MRSRGRVRRCDMSHGVPQPAMHGTGMRGFRHREQQGEPGRHDRRDQTAEDGHATGAEHTE